MSEHDKAAGRPDWLVVGLLVGVLLTLGWSVYHPHDMETWALEVFPAVVGMVVLGATYRRYTFTRLTYVLISLHMVVLIVGGHYTYAEVPLFSWLRDHYHLSRNHYDRLGHFVQGFVPAMMAREMLLRCTPLKRGRWLVMIVFSVCMAISALYELLEWRVAVWDDAGSQAFLGTQGDPWDTQEDMAMCGVGAIVSLLVMARWQDRELKGMAAEKY